MEKTCTAPLAPGVAAAAANRDVRVTKYAHKEPPPHTARRMTPKTNDRKLVKKTETAQRRNGGPRRPSGSTAHRQSMLQMTQGIMKRTTCSRVTTEVMRWTLMPMSRTTWGRRSRAARAKKGPPTEPPPASRREPRRDEARDRRKRRAAGCAANLATPNRTAQTSSTRSQACQHQHSPQRRREL